MEKATDTQILIIAVTVIVVVVILGIFKSLRIYQFKNIDKSKIDAIGKYEKNSKNIKTNYKVKNPLNK